MLKEAHEAVGRVMGVPTMECGVSERRTDDSACSITISDPFKIMKMKSCSLAPPLHRVPARSTAAWAKPPLTPVMSPH